MLDSWILLWKGRVKLPRFHSASYLYPTVFLFHFSHPLPVQHPDSPILPQGVRQRQCCMEWGSRARQLLCQPGSQTELPIFTPLNTWAQQLIPSLNPSAPLCPAPRACRDKEETGTGCACWEKRGWDWGTGLCRGSGPLRTAAAAWGSLSCEDQSPSGGKDSSGWQCPACPMLCHSSTKLHTHTGNPTLPRVTGWMPQLKPSLCNQVMTNIQVKCPVFLITSKYFYR